MPIKKNVNKDFFKKWSPDMAYVLGFFFADGTITVNKNRSSYFVIQINDLGLLKEIRMAMDAEHKVSKRVHKKDHSIFYRMQIGSQDIVSDVQKLGGVPGKTMRMRLPNIPQRYIGDFVRGYFDGDGNVWMGNIHRKRNKALLVIQTGFTSCSHEFLQSLQRKLEQFHIYGSVYKREKHNVFRLQYSVKSSILLYRLMYYSVPNGLFLNRKKQVFESFLKLRKKQQ